MVDIFLLEMLGVCPRSLQKALLIEICQLGEMSRSMWQQGTIM